MLFRYVGKWFLVFKSIINYFSLLVRYSVKYELIRLFKIYSEYFVCNIDLIVGFIKKDFEVKVILNRLVFLLYCLFCFIFYGSFCYF